jgi:hypothetical protein
MTEQRLQLSEDGQMHRSAHGNLGWLCQLRQPEFEALQQRFVRRQIPALIEFTEEMAGFLDCIHNPVQLESDAGLRLEEAFLYQARRSGICRAVIIKLFMQLSN